MCPGAADSRARPLGTTRGLPVPVSERRSMVKGLFVRLVCTAALASSLLESSSAMADPEVRDHRDPVVAPAAQPVVTIGPRYRRRPGPRFMMPLKVDIGAAGANTARGFAPGIGAAVGIHWASLSP